MSILLTSMLGSAMWYGTVPESSGGSQGLKMGPFALDYSEIGIGRTVTHPDLRLLRI